MKKIFAVVLSLLLLLPMFASLVYADDTNVSSQNEVTEYPEKNIAKDASFSIEGANAASDVNFNALVDGDKSTGSVSPFTRKFGYVFSYNATQYFTKLYFKLNGSGTIVYPGGGYTEEVTDAFNIKKVTVVLTKNGKEVYNSGELDVSQLEEISLDVNTMADKIAIRMPQSDRSANYYFWEVEAYAKVGMPLCDVQLHNVAKEARFSYWTGREDDPETEADESQAGMWWAVNWLALVDGNIETGTHSPKGNSYYIYMDFSQEYLISEFVFYCNGKGFLDDGSFATIKEYQENNSMVKICLYDLNGELVYDSKDVSVSGPTAKIDPYVNASRIEIQMFNGKHSGGEYMWEIEANIESGNHMFELTDTKNPTCDKPGYKELSCHCGKVIKQVIPATGFHQWDEGVEITSPTAAANGVCEKSCVLCGTKGNFDIPATGHTWNDGQVVAPNCTDSGYTVYTCTCAGCTEKLTYKTDYTQALGHDWDDGVVTKPAKLNEQGEKRVTCLREGCGIQKISSTRALTYFDNTAPVYFDGKTVTSAKIDFTNASKDKDVAGYYNPESTTPLPKDEDIWNMFDDNPTTSFYAPTGSVVLLELDKTYYFTSFSFYASANYCKVTVEFLDANGKTVISFLSPAIDNGNNEDSLVTVDLAKVVGNGIEAKTVKIIFSQTKWDNGSAMKIHDVYATAHACLITEDDYADETDPSYVAPTCTKDGSVDATCPVCNEKTKVTLPSTKYGHDVPENEMVVDLEATCSKDGYGHGNCKDCGERIDNIVIPATGVHEYTKGIDFVEAKCGFLGVKQMVCPGCGRVGSQSPIEATGEHDFDWVIYSPTTFTASGKKAWECTVCEAHDPNKAEEDRIEVIPMKEPTQELATYVDKTIANGQVVLHFVLNLEYYEEVEYECDIRVITTMVDPDGNVQTYESYGKYSKNEFDPETGAVDAILTPSGKIGTYQISTAVRLMNFRGVEYIDVDLDPTTPEVDKFIELVIE